MTQTVLSLVIPVIFVILFLQSGFDKVFHYQSNLEWLSGHFSRSPFSGMVPLLLIVLAILEIAAGTITGVGVVVRLINGREMLLEIGLIISLTALVSLFLGQRLAKDYSGAASLMIYIVGGVLGLFLVYLN